jgi:glutathione S-transferase
MNLSLYYAPSSRAGRVRWLLEELAVPYQLIRIDMKTKDTDAGFRAASPLGKVPVLVVDDQPMIESTAMLIWLADRFADRGLAPALDAPERAAYLQWHAFVPITIEPPLLDLYKPLDEPAKAAARERTLEALGVLAGALADGREWLLGRFTAADCAAGQVTGWARGAGVLDRFPALAAYGKRVAARPAYQASRAD